MTQMQGSVCCGLFTCATQQHATSRALTDLTADVRTQTKCGRSSSPLVHLSDHVMCERHAPRAALSRRPTLRLHGAGSVIRRVQRHLRPDRTCEQTMFPIEQRT